MYIKAQSDCRRKHRGFVVFLDACFLLLLFEWELHMLQAIVLYNLRQPAQVEISAHTSPK